MAQQLSRSAFRWFCVRKPRIFGTVFFSTSEPPVISLPESTKGLKNLDPKSLLHFEKKIRVPTLQISTKQERQIRDFINSYRLKLLGLQAFEVGSEPEKKFILLNPDIVKSFESFGMKERERLKKIGISEDLGWKEITVGYENWPMEEIFKSVLPEGESLSGYVQMGHIVLVNLEEQLLPYKQIIGQVLLDKIRDAKTVINKDEQISNSFRTFKVEVLAGENKMETQVKEENLHFCFDFSKVYWNSRLWFERNRILSKLKHNSIVYDVFAGVGPFAILAGKRQHCTVLANDLNPDSYKWLQHNIKLNKVQDYVTAYNLDAREFLKNVVRDDLIEQWNEMAEYNGSIPVHIFMNLPGMAVDFLDEFLGMFSDCSTVTPDAESLPIIHCYMFIKEPDRNKVVARINEQLQGKIAEEDIEVHHVRDVTPSKAMMCASFRLTHQVLFDSKKSDKMSN